MPLIPIIGYAPDLSPLTPGVLTNCAAFLPSLKGMRAAPTPQNTDLPALSAACKGAAAVRKLDDTTRLIAGTAEGLYESGTGAWTDRTNAGGAYSLSDGHRWRFAQFNDVTLAAAKSEILQFSSSGAFDDAASDAPKGAIVETVNNFVFLFDVNDQGEIYDSADRPHGWWCAGIGGYTVWTPSIANQSYTGDLTSTPGKIRAGRRFGRSIVAYKERSMYLGTYAGQQGWDFDLLPGEAGALSQEVVIDVGTSDNPKHIFMGADDFYVFDGSRAVPIGNDLKQTVFQELNREYRHACTALHDRVNSRIYFYYPVENSENPNKCVVLNYKTMRWGRDDRSVEAVVDYVAAGITWNDLGTYYATWDSLPAMPWDTAFLAADSITPAIFNTAHKIQTLDGAPRVGSITTGDYGSDSLLTLVTRVIPQFLIRPSSGTLTPQYRMALGDSLTSDSQVAMTSKGRFDYMRSANWHRAVLEFTGDCELAALDVASQEDGEE